MPSESTRGFSVIQRRDHREITEAPATQRGGIRSVDQLVSMMAYNAQITNERCPSQSERMQAMMTALQERQEHDYLNKSIEQKIREIENLTPRNEEERIKMEMNIRRDNLARSIQKRHRELEAQSIQVFDAITKRDLERIEQEFVRSIDNNPSQREAILDTMHAELSKKRNDREKRRRNFLNTSVAKKHKEINDHYSQCLEAIQKDENELLRRATSSQQEWRRKDT